MTEYKKEPPKPCTQSIFVSDFTIENNLEYLIRYANSLLMSYQTGNVASEEYNVSVLQAIIEAAKRIWDLVPDEPVAFALEDWGKIK